MIKYSREICTMAVTMDPMNLLKKRILYSE